MDLCDKIEFFQDLITCGQNIYYTKYDSELNFIDSNCSLGKLFDKILSSSGCKNIIRETESDKNSYPLFLSDDFYLQWIAVVSELDGSVHIIGPVSYTEYTDLKITRTLSLRYERSELIAIKNLFADLPFMPLSSWIQYGLMLYYCVNGKKIDISDCNFRNVGEEKLSLRDMEARKERENSWESEQLAMKLVENGDVNYKKILTRLSLHGNIGDNFDESSIRDLKNMVIAFITLVSRAAIRGGMDLGAAYYVGGRYISFVENAKTVQELIKLNNTMYDDFIKRVNKIKTQDELTYDIQKCKHYVALHLCEKISLKEMADFVGYSAGYLSEIFKDKTGVTISEYVKSERIEKAKYLLRSTNESIAEISAETGFCNTSYFIKCFRSLVGTTPHEYREKS